MGQKTHPYGFRLGVIKTWKSKWYEDKLYAKWLHEDLGLKAKIREKFAHAGIADIEIERAANKAKVVIYTSRPGIIIGKRGAGVEQLKADLQKLTRRSTLTEPSARRISLVCRSARRRFGWTRGTSRRCRGRGPTACRPPS